MTYVHYNHTRTREPSPYYSESDSMFSRPLVRRYSKRQRIEDYDNDDDLFDDYPRSSPLKPTQPSRALTIRQPSQLEKYNVYNNGGKREDVEHDHHYHRTHRNHRVYKYNVGHRSDADSDDDRDEREFQLKVKATLSRPRSSDTHADTPRAWPAAVFKRKEKWERTDWESKERSGGDVFWDREPATKEYRYRTMKRTRTDEWKPLSGWRRS